MPSAAKLPVEITIIILDFLIHDHQHTTDCCWLEDPFKGDLPCQSIRRVLRGCSFISPVWLKATRQRLFGSFPAPRTETTLQGLRRILASPHLTIECNEVKTLIVKGNAPAEWISLGSSWYRTRPSVRVDPAEKERVQNLTNTLENFLEWAFGNPRSGSPTFANLMELRFSEVYFCSSKLSIGEQSSDLGDWVVLTHRTQYSVAHSVPALKRLAMGQVKFLDDVLFTWLLRSFSETLEELTLDHVEIDTYIDFSRRSEIPSHWFSDDAILPRLRVLRLSKSAIHTAPFFIPSPNLREIFVDVTEAGIDKEETLEALVTLASSSQYLESITVDGQSYNGFRRRIDGTISIWSSHLSDTHQRPFLTLISLVLFQNFVCEPISLQSQFQHSPTCLRHRPLSSEPER
ncbi:hypothetical protein AAF712_006267 [Marasmius tenuissimus]|uniref:F-box domain-containing protein n=1 Tax=Marasmius tenuissimus TaxID=585030 RepID=A0ABR2ZZU7_9AGAR